jgi:hypothetical protein
MPTIPVQTHVLPPQGLPPVAPTTNIPKAEVSPTAKSEDGAKTVQPEKKEKVKRTLSLKTKRPQSFKDKYKLPAELPPSEMEGMLERKQELQSGGKKATIRSWKNYLTVLCGQLLCFFKDKHAFSENQAACSPLILLNARCEIATDYTKKKNVLRLRLSDGSEYLLMANSQNTMVEWLSKIQFYAVSSDDSSLTPAQQLTHYPPERTSVHGSPTSTSSRTSDRRPASPAGSSKHSGSPGSTRRHIPASPASSTRSSVSGDVRPGSTSPRHPASHSDEQLQGSGHNPFRQGSAGSTHSNPFATANNPFVEPGNPFTNQDGKRSSRDNKRDRLSAEYPGAAQGEVLEPAASSVDPHKSTGSLPSESAGAAEAVHSRQSSNISDPGSRGPPPSYNNMADTRPVTDNGQGMTNGSNGAYNARHSMPPPASAPYQAAGGATNRPVSYAQTLPPGTLPPGGQDPQRAATLDRRDGKPPIAPKSDKEKKHHRGVLGSIFKKSKKDRKSDV